MEHEDSETDDEDDLKDIETQMQQLAPSESAQTDQIPSDKDDTSEEEEEETEEDSKLDIDSVTDKVRVQESHAHVVLDVLALLWPFYFISELQLNLYVLLHFI